MNAKEIAEALNYVARETKEQMNMRAGGNLGMAFIAAAISEHAAAVLALASAISALPVSWTAKSPAPDFRGETAPNKVEIT
jgi:hypothetical protein